tara:strand:+ start:462 stop:878 length:417 start_codon:yes stop_codon:yes gene_type:complete
MDSDWKKRLMRDLLALGGWPIIILAIVRAAIGEFSALFYMLIIVVGLLVVGKLIVPMNQVLGRGFMLGLYLSLYYKDWTFAVFALVVWILMIVSVIYLLRSKRLETTRREVIIGTSWGIVCAGLGLIIVEKLMGVSIF